MHCEQLSFATSLGLSEKLVDAWKLVHISDVNERTWWNGKGQRKTICCSWRSDTRALQEEWGNSLSAVLQSFSLSNQTKVIICHDLFNGIRVVEYGNLYDQMNGVVIFVVVRIPWLLLLPIIRHPSSFNPAPNPSLLLFFVNAKVQCQEVTCFMWCSPTFLLEY